MTTVVTGRGIEMVSLLALRGALWLETRWMKKRGRSAGMIVKELLGTTGHKLSLLKQLEDHIEIDIPLNNRYTER